MPEIEITLEQTRAIASWLKSEAELGRVKMVPNSDGDVVIPIVDGDPVILGFGYDENEGEGDWISTSDRVMERMRDAGLNLTSTVTENLPLVQKVFSHVML